MVYKDGVLTISDGSDGNDILKFDCTKEELEDIKKKLKEGIPDAIMLDKDVPNEWKAVFSFNTECGYVTLMLKSTFGVQIARELDFVVCVKLIGERLNRQVNFMMSNEQFIEEFRKLN